VIYNVVKCILIRSEGAAPTQLVGGRAAPTQFVRGRAATTQLVRGRAAPKQLILGTCIDTLKSGGAVS
jgi:hypothetical protein